MTINDKKDEQIKKAIKKGMVEYGYNQETLAIRVMLAKSTLNKKIRNPSTLSIDEFRRICDAVHITSDERSLMV